MGTLGHSITAGVLKSRSMQIALVVAALSLLLGAIALNRASAVAPSNEHFQRTWERTDKPIVDGVVSRTWVWGPEAISNEVSEAYFDASGGSRRVQYFDKSRMEINDPNADPNSIWFVTNGLLVVELMTGRMQIGDAAFQIRFPAEVPVAGDPNDPSGVTYSVFADFQDVPPVASGTVYTQRLHADGTVTNEAGLSGYNVSADFLDAITNHRVAAPFWDYMNSSGPVFLSGQFVNDLLFPSPFYSTGRPITEFYWVRSRVGGEERDVGIQCFERRCLTFTPGNSEGFVVEDGNVGLHYFIWRYETPDPTPTATATSQATPTSTSTSPAVPTATATMTSTVGPTATTTPVPVGVQVNARVDCDSDAIVDGVADMVGAPVICSAFIGGEIETTEDGRPTSIDEIQQLGLNNAVGGTISISFDHPTVLDTIIVTGIDYDSTAQEIEDELEAGFVTAGVGPDTPSVSPVSADPLAQLNEAAMTFTFENGDLAGTNVEQLIVDNSPLIGSTVAGTFSTVLNGSPPLDEIQELGQNLASGGSFILEFEHPTAGSITTSPIDYDASAAEVEFDILVAFTSEGVQGDTPTVSGGPADAAALVVTFDNGDLAGVDVEELTVDNAALTALITTSQVQVFDIGSAPVTTWQVDSTGAAGGLLDPASYEFCFTYTEDTGMTDTDCTGVVSVNDTNFVFGITADLEYGQPG